ncbi:MAG TPA: sigma-54 factor interaction domain-containing protein, partial [Myxococcota bacterium]|nr:sigma-54 factor interaction domain-containing protein [Myxococcota bacterium]
MSRAVELAACTIPRPELAGLKGVSAQVQRLHALIEKGARASVPILVTGESGTGKELVARAIHELSPRAAKPFVVVDCGSLSPTLIGSELFGHERGAFTGAVDRHPGAFEQAGDGTVFLDEIGELPPASQAMLLGVLERGSFRRIGGNTDIALRARIVSATNRNLRTDVSK